MNITVSENSLLRQDAYAKVTGKAKYIDDLTFPRMLFVQTVRCPHPHARVIGIDTSQAINLDGVVCILTAQDIPGINEYPKDKPVLAHEPKCTGDGVAIVVAETKSQAINAAKMVNVKYCLLPAVFTVEAALKEDAPLIHGDSNIAIYHKVEKGNVEQGFNEADIIIERAYTTQRAIHAAIEPDGAIAVPDENSITIYCPCKAPFSVKRAVAAAIGYPENRVRLIQPVIGGAFGGKGCDINIIASRAAVAALKTNRPCKMVWSREEVFLEGSKRHPFSLRYKIGAKNNGLITAIAVNGIADVGSYISKSRSVIWRAAVEATGPYNIDHVSTLISGVFTNNVYSDAVRGFGSPQVDFASESLINELASELNMSPFDIRRLNGYKKGSITATGQKLENVTLMDCLDKLEEVFPLSNSFKPKPKKAVGKGISCIFRGEARGACSVTHDAASVIILPENDGSLTVLSGISEMGQGSSSTLLLIVSNILGVPIESCILSALNTSYIPDSGPTTGSRGIITSGNAAAKAAEDLKNKISSIISRTWSVDPHDIKFCNHRLNCNNFNISFKDAIQQCLKSKPGLCGFGKWSLPPVNWDFDNNCGATYASYAFGACGAEVEVDLISGKVNVTNLVCVHDVGRILNREEVKAQITGGALMALGLALTEKADICNGLIQNNFDGYLLPTTLDFQELWPIPLEAQPALNPLGVHGIGEPSSAAVAPAILNAIENALGTRIRCLPATLENVLNALNKKHVL